MIEYFVGVSFSFNCPCLITLVLFSARPTTALFNYEITVSLQNKKGLDSSYEEQQFGITRDSFNACFFLFRVNSSAGTQRLPPKCILTNVC